MSLPRRIVLPLLSVGLFVAGLPGGASAASVLSRRGPVSALCAMDTTRGSIPAGFALDACVDGSTIVLHNQLEVPVKVTVQGATGAVVTVPGDLGIAATMTRKEISDPSLLLPSDIMRIPIGSAAATVHIDGHENGTTYIYYRVVEPVFSKFPGLDVYQAGASMARDMLEAQLGYQECLTDDHSWIGQQGCWIVYQTRVMFAVTLHSVKLGLGKIPDARAQLLSVLLDLSNYAVFLGLTVESLAKLLGANPDLVQAARPAGTKSTAPAATSPPAVRLLETIQEGHCLYTVKFLLTNFNPGSEIYVSDTHSYTWCNTGAKGTQEWTVRANGVVQPDGSLIWGYKQTVPMNSTHRLYFEDNAGNAATIKVNCSKSNVVCAVS